MSNVASRIAHARATMDAPWDDARADRVRSRALQAREARAKRRQQLRAVGSAIAGAAIFVLALRGFGGGDAGATSSAAVEGPVQHAPSSEGPMMLADGSAYARQGDGGFEGSAQ